jgi:hypothetical protein
MSGHSIQFTADIILVKMSKIPGQLSSLQRNSRKVAYVVIAVTEILDIVCRPRLNARKVLVDQYACVFRRKAGSDESAQVGPVERGGLTP